jgi:glycerate kinase
MSMVGFSEALAMADLVVTGEGSFDEQSLLGKTTGGVIEQAQRAGVPVWVVCGVTGFTTPPDGVVVKTLLEKAAGMEDAMARAGELLGQLGHELAETLTAH